MTSPRMMPATPQRSSGAVSQLISLDQDRLLMLPLTRSPVGAQSKYLIDAQCIGLERREHLLEPVQMLNAPQRSGSRPVAHAGEGDAKSTVPVWR